MKHYISKKTHLQWRSGLLVEIIYSKILFILSVIKFFQISLVYLNQIRAFVRLREQQYNL